MLAWGHGRTGTGSWHLRAHVALLFGYFRRLATDRCLCGPPVSSALTAPTTRLWVSSFVGLVAVALVADATRPAAWVPLTLEAPRPCPSTGLAGRPRGVSAQGLPALRRAPPQVRHGEGCPALLKRALPPGRTDRIIPWMTVRVPGSPVAHRRLAAAGRSSTSFLLDRGRGEG